jgi:hypothetical protein
MKSKTKKEEPKQEFSGITYAIRRSGFLAEAVELTIEDGIVVNEKVLGPVDMPATVIGKHVQQKLWKQYRGE